MCEMQTSAPTGVGWSVLLANTWSNMLNLSVRTCNECSVSATRLIATLQMLPSLAQRLPASVEMPVAKLLLCLSSMLQRDSEPIVTCLIAVACDLVLDALDELRHLFVNVSIRLTLAPIRCDQ